ncbi:MAG: ABC transporter substrate-binding protein [Proteobacteria bacterium]|nr:ABC transporter substrate-binding protein [Pseudomonadota bacterium]
MMTKKGLALILGVLMLALVAGPLPGYAEEAKEAYYLSLSDFTGPIAGLALAGSQGEEDYFKYFNDQGGYKGVTVKYIGVDTRYDVARALSAYKRYRKTPHLLLVNTISTGLGKAIYPLIVRDKLINLTPGDGEFQAKLSRTFIYSTPYQDGFAATLDWVLEDWKKKGKSGAPVVGLISWDNPYGREPYRGGKEYAEKIGIKLLDPELFPPGSLKHDVWLNRLAKNGANYVYVGGVDPTQTNVIRDAYALGLTKDIQFMTDYWGPDMGVGVKDHPKELEGSIIVNCFIRGTDARSHPLGTKLWQQYRKKSVDEMVSAYYIGLSHAMHYVAGMKIALDAGGFEKLDGDAMYQAYQQLHGKELTQGITGKTDYSPTSRRMSRYVKFYQVTGGKVVPVTDWRMAPDAVSLHKFE